jgi:protein SCO1
MLALTSAIAFGSVSYYNITHADKLTTTASKVTTVGTALLGGDWTLVDTESGKFVTNEDYKGEVLLLYFGFAHCPDICPSELRKLSSVLEECKSSGISNIRGLFVTVDPARDSVDNLRKYKLDFHPSITYLTGTPEMIKRMAKLYRVYISKADETEDGDYLVDHSIVIYGVKKDGEFGDFFTQSMKKGDIVKKIKAILND